MNSSLLLFAQQPPAQPATDCATFPSDSSTQTIVLRLKDADCHVDPYDGSTGIPFLRTWQNSPAYWEVCNYCGAAVDVRISNSAPSTLKELFPNYFDPPIEPGGDNESIASNIPDGARNYRAFRGVGTNDGEVAGHLNIYDIAVKFSNEGPTGWRGFDPELQIDEGGGLKPGLVTMTVIPILVLVVGLVIGWVLGRRRNTVQP